jgi:threonine/homoserine/homoserine lactone efflux protein
MKSLIAVLSTAILSFVAGIFFPWWTVALAAGLVALLMPQKSFISFLCGFGGVFMLWLGLTIWIDRSNDGLLSARMAQVLPVGGNVVYLHLLTAFVGGLIGGLAALSGKHLRSIFSSVVS